MVIDVRGHQRETLRVRMATIGFPEPVVAHVDGEMLLDFCWPTKALAVVLQSYELTTHNALAAVGWRVIYFQGSMVFQPYAIGIIAQALGIDPNLAMKADREFSGLNPARAGIRASIPDN